MRRFALDEFSEKYESTVGVDFTIKEIVVDGHALAVQVSKNLCFGYFLFA